MITLPLLLLILAFVCSVIALFGDLSERYKLTTIAVLLLLLSNFSVTSINGPDRRTRELSVRTRLVCAIQFSWGEPGTELENYSGPDVWQIKVLEDLSTGLISIQEAVQNCPCVRSRE